MKTFYIFLLTVLVFGFFFQSCNSVESRPVDFSVVDNNIIVQSDTINVLQNLDRATLIEVDSSDVAMVKTDTEKIFINKSNSTVIAVSLLPRDSILDEYPIDPSSIQANRKLGKQILKKVKGR